MSFSEKSASKTEERYCDLMDVLMIDSTTSEMMLIELLAVEVGFVRCVQSVVLKNASFCG